MFVGDGMGVSTVTAGRVYMSQTRELYGDASYLSFEKMPYVGLSRVRHMKELLSNSIYVVVLHFSLDSSIFIHYWARLLKD